MKRRRLIGGPVLLGFADLFDAAWGRPQAGPLPVVAPTCIGGTLLPFPCPHCSAVRPALADPRRRDAWRDPWRDFFWCPACQGRFQLEPAGTPLPAPLAAGAPAAPARVTVGGVAYVMSPFSAHGGDLDLLEAP